MSFLKNPTAPGVNIDKIDMATTECVHNFSSQPLLFFLIVYRIDTVTDFFTRMLESVNIDALPFRLTYFIYKQ